MNENLYQVVEIESNGISSSRGVNFLDPIAALDVFSAKLPGICAADNMRPKYLELTFRIVGTHAVTIASEDLRYAEIGEFDGAPGYEFVEFYASDYDSDAAAEYLAKKFKRGDLSRTRLYDLRERKVVLDLHKESK